MENGQNESGMVRPWLLLVLLVVVLAGIGFFSWNYLQGKKTDNKTTAVNSNIVSPVAIASLSPDSTAGWKTYIDTADGWSFKYPDYAYISDISTSTAVVANKVGISVLTYPYTTLKNCKDNPENLSDCVAIEKNRETMIAGGKSAVLFDFALDNTSKLITTPGLAGNESTSLNGPVAASITFSRFAVIYHGDIASDNGEAIVLSAFGNEKQIETANPNYFTKIGCHSDENPNDPNYNAPNCTGYKDVNAFYADLVAGKTDSISQQWYKTIDQILPTVTFVK